MAHGASAGWMAMADPSWASARASMRQVCFGSEVYFLAEKADFGCSGRTCPMAHGSVRVLAVNPPRAAPLSPLLRRVSARQSALSVRDAEG